MPENMRAKVLASLNVEGYYKEVEGLDLIRLPTAEAAE